MIYSNECVSTSTLLIPYSRTIKLAIPIPVPIHILTTPVLSPLRPNSANIVPTILPPVAPNGCPSAIAPPFTLILSSKISSRPRSRIQCKAWLANASLISQRSISCVERLREESRAGMARAGPMPIREGAQPTTRVETHLPRMEGVRFSAEAVERRMRRVAVAPSVV